MPSKNIVKEFADDQYYHVYNRGVEKRRIFLDDQDYTVFLGLLKKYLSGENDNKSNRHKFTRLDNKVQLLSYCLMPNHFHLLLYHIQGQGVTQLMRRVGTGYAMYFNDRYKRVGPLFQGIYKASHINEDGYLHHISRYIHMNPEDYNSWPYSSLCYYIGTTKTPAWLHPQAIMELFDNDKVQYQEYLKGYEDSKDELSVLKWQLANDPDEM